VGFDQFECKSCGLRRDPETGMAYVEFQSDPIVQGLGTTGKLRDGDVIRSVNGLRVNTPAGAKALATLPSGAEARFVVSRRGTPLGVTVTPEFTCAVAPSSAGSAVSGRPLDSQIDFVTRLHRDAWSVAQADTRANIFRGSQFGAQEFSMGGVQQSSVLTQGLRVSGAISLAGDLNPLPKAWFGFALSCDSCSYASGGSEPAWPGALFNSVVDVPPQVVDVDSAGPAARGGLRPGDLLVSINGTPITTPEGRNRFLATSPGDTVVFRYSRGQTIHTARVIAGARPQATAGQTTMKAMTMSISGLAAGAVLEINGEDVTMTEDPKAGEVTITGKNIKLVLRKSPPGYQQRREF
jgi:hypothetical protein